MNLERSEDERRFETQQLEAAQLDDDGPSPNPFIAALGLAGIVAIVALMILVWPILESAVGALRYGVDRVSVLLNKVYSVRWLESVALKPYAKALIVLLGTTISVFAHLSLSRWRSTIAAIARSRAK